MFSFILITLIVWFGAKRPEPTNKILKVLLYVYIFWALIYLSSNI